MAHNLLQEEQKFPMNTASKYNKPKLSTEFIFLILIYSFFFFSLDSLHAYRGEDVIIQLPGDMTIFNINWLSIFDVETASNFGSVIIPKELNVPPSLVKVIHSFNLVLSDR